LVSGYYLGFGRTDRTRPSLPIQTRNTALHLPALFLAKGQALASGDKPDIRTAEESFEKAMTFARQQSALSFELRVGLELARVWIERGEVQSPMI
jgi:hypothetical protein